MNGTVALIGFGEAGRTFAGAGHWGASAKAHDLLIGEAEMDAAIAQAGVAPCATLADALDGAPLVLSLVTADQAPLVAQEAAKLIAPGTLYCDMNSVAPQTKQEAARAIEAAGAHYVDVAVMAPVNPARLSVPLLLAGERAEQARTLLEALGFANTRIVGGEVGRASAIKMIRSVMVKGMEALTAECMLAAQQAGVLDEVLSSLDASEKPRPWEERADYNLDRMMIHGQRRAAEMEEVVKTLEGLGTGAAMTRGTVQRQRAIGALGLKQPETGLAGKIEQVNRKGGMQTA
ncbi:6-phosphogluconate dehydrogenase [Sphingobium jiangsuense]|uniref:3-hydroxyisobutyrate dehydrogenase-like beta-hydroxyacid dehydrogenase n=1 Tax=Sphingobium jiangsuense TaxID=870476 RepID=A0A7W6BJ69_9SPHN|nr:NAD(P)-dependent oxidoreductase [Sphingobium jiangsuense]MBB3927980.1 3-hydroxyisobutyrate dehydrogenase-like beta-hydroxyacid dehydrogenase [Sphingobium jiangsuense]GLT00455.1 6-phosphogluconate dehydrogenase [Sphingobium jiangsuense]